MSGKRMYAHNYTRVGFHMITTVTAVDGTTLFTPDGGKGPDLYVATIVNVWSLLKDASRIQRAL
ncbi:MAG: hypothetical protein K9N51_04160 [Candidatus Pacebacteria bacterium]|nr:hypothetical protein [Candidatus Paceibacterota bacterium]